MKSSTVDIMTVLVDTNVIVAFIVKSDIFHDKAVGLLERLKSNEFGGLYITDFVFDEVLTLIWIRTKRKDVVEKAFNLMNPNSGIFQMIITLESHLIPSFETWMKYAEYPKRPLSYTDASLLVIANEYHIGHIATFDGEFNGLISVLQ